MSQILPEYHLIETGLSGIHIMVVTIMKANFCKFEPEILHYRNNNNFINELFRKNLVNQLSVTGINTNDKDMVYKRGMVHRHALWKKKYIRGNQSPFVKKTLHKEVIKRTKLRNNFLKNTAKNIVKK